MVAGCCDQPLTTNSLQQQPTARLSKSRLERKRGEAGLPGHGSQTKIKAWHLLRQRAAGPDEATPQAAWPMPGRADLKGALLPRVVGERERSRTLGYGPDAAESESDGLPTRRASRPERRHSRLTAGSREAERSGRNNCEAESRVLKGKEEKGRGASTPPEYR